MKFKITGSRDDIEYYNQLIYCISAERDNPYWKKNIENNSSVREFKEYHYTLEALPIKSEYLIQSLESGKKAFWQNKDFFCFLDQEEQKIETERLNQELLKEYTPYIEKLHSVQNQYVKKLVVSIPYLTEIRSFLNKKFYCDKDKDLYKSMSKELNIIEEDVIHGCYNHLSQGDLEIACSGNITSDE